MWKNRWITKEEVHQEEQIGLEKDDRSYFSKIEEAMNQHHKKALIFCNMELVS